MAQTAEWALRLFETPDGWYSYLLHEQGDSGPVWVADVEWGPFDTYWDVARWLVRSMNDYTKLRTR